MGPFISLTSPDLHATQGPHQAAEPRRSPQPSQESPHSQSGAPTSPPPSVCSPGARRRGAETPHQRASRTIHTATQTRLPWRRGGPREIQAIIHSEPPPAPTHSLRCFASESGSLGPWKLRPCRKLSPPPQPRTQGSPGRPRACHRNASEAIFLRATSLRTGWAWRPASSSRGSAGREGGRPRAGRGGRVGVQAALDGGADADGRAV